jgi:hypothetical protein
LHLNLIIFNDARRDYRAVKSKNIRLTGLIDEKLAAKMKILYYSRSVSRVTSKKRPGKHNNGSDR